MDSANKNLLGLLFFYVIYLFIGAAIFDALESPHEYESINKLNQYVREFKEKYSSCLNASELNEFIRYVSIANDKGVPATANVSKEQNWSFGQAVFFSGTVVTTIGYGSAAPITKLGKLFCIVFALIGIPATLLLLYAIIERLMRVTSYLLNLFTEILLPILNNKFKYRELNKSHMRIGFTITCTFLVFIFLFIVPALIYSHIEGWSFLNSFYYCFISLSTVGLGDYVPGDSVNQQNLHFYKICSTIYLIGGVLVMVWLLQIYSETPEFNIYKHFTLVKDGLLTRHRDIIHGTSSCAYITQSSNQNLNSNNRDIDSSAYQTQLNEGIKLSPAQQNYESTVTNQHSFSNIS